MTLADHPQALIDAQSDDAYVRFDLPLPLDMAATLMNLLGLAYPGAMIDLRHGDPRRMVIRVPDGERRRPKRVSKRAAEAARAIANDEDEEGLLGEMSEAGNVMIHPPERLAKAMVASLEASFEDEPLAENYLEWKLHDRSNHARTWVVIAARSEGQTPHALRMKAEQERDAALALLAELGVE